LLGHLCENVLGALGDRLQGKVRFVSGDGPAVTERALPFAVAAAPESVAHKHDHVAARRAWVKPKGRDVLRF